MIGNHNPAMLDRLAGELAGGAAVYPVDIALLSAHLLNFPKFMDDSLAVVVGVEVAATHYQVSRLKAIVQLLSDDLGGVRSLFWGVFTGQIVRVPEDSLLTAG